jgi:hypothetical protein
MSRLTIFLGRLLGLFFVLMALAMLINRHTTVEAVADFMHDPPPLMIAGMISLAAGLAIVLGHNRWSGGALAVVVTLLGWIFLVRGLMILCLPRETLVRVFEKLGFDQHFHFYVAITLVIGLYLTYAGFSSSMPLDERG